MSTTIPTEFTTEELRGLAQQARVAAAQAKASKRKYRLYLKLANGIDQLLTDHGTLVSLTRGLVAHIAEGEKRDARGKETPDADRG